LYIIAEIQENDSSRTAAQSTWLTFSSYEPLLFLDEIKVKEVMTKSPIVIHENTTRQEASKIMEDAHIHRLPVVKNGVLVGTVTRHDLLMA